MDASKGLHIVVVADNTPRSASLAGMIRDGFSEPVEVKVMKYQASISEENEIDADVCVVDLLSSEEPVRTCVPGLKQALPHCKMIALHIYTSAALVAPIYSLGIDGYLHSDPSREELVKAIRRVALGERYYPSFMEVDENT
jgi:DNA-binding NarL/FixJ family response regulator